MSRWWAWVHKPRTGAAVTALSAEVDRLTGEKIALLADLASAEREVQCLHQTSNTHWARLVEERRRSTDLGLQVLAWRRRAELAEAQADALKPRASTGGAEVLRLKATLLRLEDRLATAEGRPVAMAKVWR